MGWCGQRLLARAHEIAEQLAKPPPLTDTPITLAKAPTDRRRGYRLRARIGVSKRNVAIDSAEPPKTPAAVGRMNDRFA
jgi:hypothetical protein